VHHVDPGGICTSNHVTLADPVMRVRHCIRLLSGLFSPGELSRDQDLVECATQLFTQLGLYNHVICHGSSRNYQIPAWIRTMHRYHLLPTPKEHQSHHKTFTNNWWMLNGPTWLIEKVYKNHPWSNHPGVQHMVTHGLMALSLTTVMPPLCG
jgi:hypothetical protein